MPRVDIQDRRTVILMPKGNLVGLVGSFPDELSAFPHFQYLKGLRDLGGSTVLMTVSEESSGPCYKLYVLLEDDLLSQTARLVQLQSNGYSTSFEKASPPSSRIQNWREQTRLFDAAYDGPVKKRLLQLSRTALTSAVAKVIIFKTRTDRRVRERIEPWVGMALTTNGGPGHPNLRYSEGVSIVSAYAHRVLSIAAGRKGDSVADTRLKIAGRRRMQAPSFADTEVSTLVKRDGSKETTWERPRSSLYC